MDLSGRKLASLEGYRHYLMVCDDPGVGANPGVLDYQDALLGPISYDIASLVFDARTTWEEPQQLDWAIRYWERARAAGLPVDADFAVFYKQFPRVLPPGKDFNGACAENGALEEGR